MVTCEQLVLLLEVAQAPHRKSAQGCRVFFTCALPFLSLYTSLMFDLPQPTGIGANEWHMA